MELASAIRHQAHLTPPRSSQPWSCSLRWPGRGPLSGTPGGLVGLFLQPCCLSTPGHTWAPWAGLWQSQGVP